LSTFSKASLKGARQRKRATSVKVEGQKSYVEAVPGTVERAKALRAESLTPRQAKLPTVWRRKDTRRAPGSCFSSQLSVA
jgi:hypothetical protein